MQRSFIKIKFYRIHLPKVFLIAFIVALVTFLPNPQWLCKKIAVNNITAEVDVSAYNVLSTLKTNVVDPEVNIVGHMFPIYLKDNQEKHRSTFNIKMKPSLKSKVNIFQLQNSNFTKFSRSWVNKPEQQLDTRINVDKLKKVYKLPDCVHLKVPPEAFPTKICVHFPEDDNFISNRLRDTGEWEMELLFQLDAFFTKNPDSQLVDLGCNIGVFTLFAASLGKYALAVDILPSNLALLHLSILTNDEKSAKNQVQELNLADDNDGIGEVLKQILPPQVRFSHLITMAHNAIYSKRQKMQVYLKPWDLNLGGTEVKEVNSADANNTESTILVDSICLDDLLPFVKANLSVFLKVDVEGSEPDVFLCASNFFMYVDVRGILMEILFHRYSKQGQEMTKFLLNQSMLPSEDVNGRKMLDPDPNKMHSWPENMFWIKVR